MTRGTKHLMEHLTREAALEIARAQALRDLTETADCISYVGYVEILCDYCLCQFQPDIEQYWHFSCTALPFEDRQPTEQITDAHIVAVARDGKMLQAIRLYRCQYDTGLAEAKAGVSRLQEEAA